MGDATRCAVDRVATPMYYLYVCKVWLMSNLAFLCLFSDSFCATLGTFLRVNWRFFFICSKAKMYLFEIQIKISDSKWSVSFYRHEIRSNVYLNNLMDSVDFLHCFLLRQLKKSKLLHVDDSCKITRSQYCHWQSWFPSKNVSLYKNYNFKKKTPPYSEPSV